MDSLGRGEANDYWNADDARVSDADLAAVPAALHVAGQAVGGSSVDQLMLLRPVLGRIGAKIAPTLSSEQAENWMRATLEALSDLPPDLVAKGLEAAKHTAMQFPSEVEGVVRAAVGDELMARHRIRNRLTMLAKRAAAAPPPSEVCTPEQAAAIKAEIGIAPTERAKAERGPPRMPTVADYMTLGLSQDAAEAAVAQQQGQRRDMAGLDRDSAKSASDILGAAKRDWRAPPEPLAQAA